MDEIELEQKIIGQGDNVLTQEIERVNPLHGRVKVYPDDFREAATLPVSSPGKSAPTEQVKQSHKIIRV